MKLVPSLIVLVLISTLLVVFQNCGRAMHNDFQNGESIFTSSTLTPNALYLRDASAQNTPFRVSALASAFSVGSQFFWNASYGNATYCGQTVSTDGLTATFTCVQAGNVTVKLTATEPTGELNEFTLVVKIDTNGTPPGPQPTPTPTPTPVPMPVPMPSPGLNGTALYATNCQGCHGQLASSSKRGITIGRLNNAIATVGAMARLSGLTSDERAAIVQALQ